MSQNCEDLGEHNLLKPALPETFDVGEGIVELTEMQRSIRQDRLDAGDENAAIKFKYQQRFMSAPTNPPQQQQQQRQGGSPAPQGGQRQGMQQQNQQNMKRTSIFHLKIITYINYFLDR